MESSGEVQQPAAAGRRSHGACHGCAPAPLPPRAQHPPPTRAALPAPGRDEPDARRRLSCGGRHAPGAGHPADLHVDGRLGRDEEVERRAARSPRTHAARGQLHRHAWSGRLADGAQRVPGALRRVQQRGPGAGRHDAREGGAQQHVPGGASHATHAHAAPRARPLLPTPRPRPRPRPRTPSRAPCPGRSSRRTTAARRRSRRTCSPA